MIVMIMMIVVAAKNYSNDCNKNKNNILPNGSNYNITLTIILLIITMTIIVRVDGKITKNRYTDQLYLQYYYIKLAEVVE